MSAKTDVIEKLEWDPLFISSKEALKMICEGFVSEDVLKKELKVISEEIKNGSKSILISAQKYKLDLINEAHSFISDGIFSAEDIHNLQTYYNRQDMTIFATPRELNAETEMAWSIIYPLIDRYERWKKVRELFRAEVIDATQSELARAAIISGESFDDDMTKSILFLDRMKYAKQKGIVDEKGYLKAVQLIPLMRKEILGEMPHAAQMNSQEIVEGIEQGDKAAIKEEISQEENTELNEFTQENDPILQWRRLVLILIDAWESMLQVRLKDEFKTIIDGNDILILQETHKYLVGLNKEFMSSEKKAEEKNQYFTGKITQFTSENSKKSMSVLT